MTPQHLAANQEKGAVLLQRIESVVKQGVFGSPFAMLPVSANKCAAKNNGQTGAKDRLSEADQSGRHTWQTGPRSLRWQPLWRLSQLVRAKGRHATTVLHTTPSRLSFTTNAGEVL